MDFVKYCLDVFTVDTYWWLITLLVVAAATASYYMTTFMIATQRRSTKQPNSKYKYENVTMDQPSKIPVSLNGQSISAKNQTLFEVFLPTNYISTSALQLENAFRRQEPPTIGPAMTVPHDGALARHKIVSASKRSSVPQEILVMHTAITESRLFLMRHAERMDHIDSKWRSKPLYANIPATDPPLSDVGRRQAVEAALHFRHNIQKKGTGEAIAAWSLSCVVSSPYLRCIETALTMWLIGTDCSTLFMVDPRLGDWVQAKSYTGRPVLCGNFSSRNSGEDSDLKAGGLSQYTFQLPISVLKGYWEWMQKHIFQSTDRASLVPKWVTEAAVNQWKESLEHLVITQEEFISFPTTKHVRDEHIKCSITHCYPESKESLRIRSEDALKDIVETGGVSSPYWTTEVKTADEEAVKAVARTHNVQIVRLPNAPQFPAISALVVSHADNIAASVVTLCPSFFDSKYLGSGVSVPYASLTLLRKLCPTYGLVAKTGGTSRKTGGMSAPSTSWTVREGPAGGGNAAFSQMAPMGSTNHLATVIKVTR